MYYYEPMRSDNNWMWGIFMMAFWLIILIVVGYIAMRLLKSHDTPGPRLDPLDIIKERYAKGEIDKEQFEQLKKDLK